MRRGGAAEKPFFLEDGETVIGFNLGADYCAEHEWGLSDLKSMFGCNDEKMGIEKRTITKIPKTMKFRISNKKNQPDILAIVGEHNWEGFADDPEKKWGYWGELEDYRWKGKTDPPTDFTGAWSGRDFGVAAYSAKAKTALAKLVAAFDNRDVAFWIGGTGDNPFARGGLCLVTVSLLPDNYRQIMLESDVDAYNLKKAAEATGIKELLEKAGKRSFALSPKWAKDIRGKSNTKYEVVFWLNPMEQHIHNHGWFTVEQLELWAQNKGPVMKTLEQRKNA